MPLVCATLMVDWHLVMQIKLLTERGKDENKKVFYPMKWTFSVLLLCVPFQFLFHRHHPLSFNWMTLFMKQFWSKS